MRNSLFSSVIAVCARFTVCLLQQECKRQTLSDAQQKTLCVSPFIQAEEVFPSLPSFPSLSLFLMQVLFRFIEKNWDT